MTNFILSGCRGFMGKVLTDMCASDPDITVVAGVDRIADAEAGYPVYTDIHQFTGKADCVLDFSVADAIEPLLKYCVATGTPIVIGTTGHNQEQLAAIEEAAKHIPVFKSGNMSLGINVLMDLAKRAAAVFGTSYDIEVVEKHHRRKVDAPSGTALMIAQSAASALPYEPEFIYERQSRRQSRGDREIGISSVRGGTIVGEHEIIFAGRDETFTISHQAYSREVFATGAMKAGIFLSKLSKPGLYDMFDLLANA